MATEFRNALLSPGQAAEWVALLQNERLSATVRLPLLREQGGTISPTRKAHPMRSGPASTAASTVARKNGARRCNISIQNVIRSPWQHGLHFAVIHTTDKAGDNLELQIFGGGLLPNSHLPRFATGIAAIGTLDTASHRCRAPILPSLGRTSYQSLWQAGLC